MNKMLILEKYLKANNVSEMKDLSIEEFLKYNAERRKFENEIKEKKKRKLGEVK